MEHKKTCKIPCSLDTTIPCSPDCKNLLEDGYIITKQCMEAGCKGIKHIVDMTDALDQEILEKYGEKIHLE